jgi:putative ABC transport system permease protein
MSISPRDLLVLTYNSLRGNLLRSLLTTLGVFMGVASVNATLQVGSISRAVIEQQLAEREAPQLSVYYWTKDGRELRLEDMEFLKQRMVGLQAISTYTQFGGDRVLFQDKQADISIAAVSQDYALTSGRLIVQGRFFNADDFANYQPLAVIDRFLADQLFQGKNPIGQRLYASDKPYLVIGVMETKLKSTEYKPSGELLVPLSLYRVLNGSREIGGLQLRPKNLEEMKDLQRQAEQLLSQRYPGGRFWAENNVDDILEQRQTLEFVSRGLLILGIIALLVGGVGIANITLASVVERTQEIGLRRAIGATQQEIRLQFILEALLLSLVGGTVAIATVHGATTMVANRFELPYKFEPDTAILALGSALLVGVGSVFVPALQASQLDPVKALRSQ